MIEVHTTRPYTQNAGYTFNNGSIYNQVGNEFQIIKRDEGVPELKSLRQDKAYANLQTLTVIGYI